MRRVKVRQMAQNRPIMANAAQNRMLQSVDAASEQFAGVITKTEKAIFDSAVELIKRLDIDANGYIKNTTANLKLLSDIKTRLARIANNKDYLRGVKDLAQAFDDIYRKQLAYYSQSFAAKTLGENHKSKFAAMQRVAVANTVEGLTGAGLQTGVLDSLNKMLLKAVTSGAKYSDLVADFKAQLISTGDSQSSLAKYAGTYATTAMTQYAGQNNKLFTDDLGTEWFEYVGSTIETTREFCNVIIEHHPYIHKSEIPDILKGEIVSQKTGEVIHVALNPKTGLPKGMIEDTTPENFQINVGGWNCRHQLVPIAKEAVPKEIRDALEDNKRIKDNPESGYAQFIRECGARLERLRQMAMIVRMDKHVDSITSDKNGAYFDYIDKLQAVEQAVNTNVAAYRTAYTNQLNAIQKIYDESVANQFNDVANKAMSVLSKYSWQRVRNAEQYSHEMESMAKEYVALKAAFDEAKATSGGALGAPIQTLQNYGVEYREVGTLPEGTTEQQIIERLCGGDKTKGSCSSLAFAYAGNVAGLDVLDFRGGRSCDYFSKSGNIGAICKAVGGRRATNFSDFDNAHELLGYVEAGKQYYFTCGSHAAIVRKTATGFEYLELQSPTPSNNGWKPLDDTVLRHRFVAKRSHSSYGHKYKVNEDLIDIELLKNNPEFRRLLGFLNTSKSEQHKGASGGIR